MSETTPNSANLLIVDDDEVIRKLLLMATTQDGWRPAAAQNGEEALKRLHPDIQAVILDHGLPGMNGSEVLSRMRAIRPDLPILMLTGLNDAETAVRSLRAGAADYLTKPFDLKRLLNLLRGYRVEAKAAEADAGRLGRPVSMSPRVIELMRQIERVAKIDSTVLLCGESGTGKTYFAREIHRQSPRVQEDFVTVSCPALPDQLLESELFGHERGAFTGAISTRVGRFEQASRGTLFLDEIGDLPTGLQPKLLNVLQDREFFRVGGSKLLRTDTRLIAATNMDLRSRVEKGTFREDLYYRLNIIELVVPPLRERREDVPLLAAGILARIASRRDTPGWRISEEAAHAMSSYDWPGNVRQLENVLERCTAFADSQNLGLAEIMPMLDAARQSGTAAAAAPVVSEPRTMREVEREAFAQAFIRSGRNKARTARELGISERSVYNLLARHNIK